MTYNELLNAKVAARDRVGMWRIVDEMLSAGLKAVERRGRCLFALWFPEMGVPPVIIHF